MNELRFEDLREGHAMTSASVVMTQPEILAFAREFDPQPMHTDPEWAAKGPMGGLIASGWHTVSVAMRLQQEAGLPATGLAEIASIAWPMPVRPDDEIQVRIEIVAIEPFAADSSRGLIRFQNTAVNASGKTVQVIAGSILMPRRTVPAQ